MPIYRDVDEAIISRSPPNVATKIAVETGRAAVWTVLFIAIVAAAALFRGALRRGRDSFYPAAGAGCVVTTVLLFFTNVGMAQTTTSVLAAAILGLALAQRVSRSIK
jgi:FtsH-binding integral membrane protein